MRIEDHSFVKRFSLSNIGIRNYLVSKKVSDSVSEIFGIGKKIRIRFRSDFGYRHTLDNGNHDDDDGDDVDASMTTISMILMVMIILMTMMTIAESLVF